MPEPISFGEIDFSLIASTGKTQGTPDARTPFTMLVMGDFSGRTNRSQNRPVTELTNLVPLLVDRDNFDTLLAKFSVELHLPLFGGKKPPLCISFSELDDFHPDALYQRLDIFQALKDIKESLKHSSTADAVVEDLLNAPSSEKHPPLPEPVREHPTGGLLDQIIENSRFEDRQTFPAKPETRWDDFLHDIVKPHLVPKGHPRQQETIDAVDAATGELMQRILHHEDFQAVEAAWRGLYFLVSRLETDRLLTLSLLDLSKTEFAEDLSGKDDLRRTALYKLWADPDAGTAGEHPWAVVTGNYTFEKQDKDLELLGRVAKTAAAAGTCFIAAAGDRFLCKSSLADTPDPDDWKPLENKSVEDNWQALRHLPEAAHIGLALPRLLLRLPYGDNTDPIDAFPLEEMPIPPVHKNYLWGNPCFASILLLGQAFTRNGWQMRPGSVLEIHSLPLHVHKKDGESFLTPCAETLLGQRAAEKIMDKGLMPLLSFLNQDMVRLGRFQSIADPPGRLAGLWR